MFHFTAELTSSVIFLAVENGFPVYQGQLKVTLKCAVGGDEILLVTSCYLNRDKLWSDGPLGPDSGFTFYFTGMNANNTVL